MRLKIRHLKPVIVVPQAGAPEPMEFARRHALRDMIKIVGADQKAAEGPPACTAPRPAPIPRSGRPSPGHSTVTCTVTKVGAVVASSLFSIDVEHVPIPSRSATWTSNRLEKGLRRTNGRT